MKPTFRKVYSAPGYWLDPEKEQRRQWEKWAEQLPQSPWQYYSGSWHNTEFDEILRESRAVEPMRGRHRDDILNLPLGAAIRADAQAQRQPTVSIHLKSLPLQDPALASPGAFEGTAANPG